MPLPIYLHAPPQKKTSPIFLDSPHKHTTHNTTMSKAPTGNEAAKHRNERTYRLPPVSFSPAIGRVLVQFSSPSPPPMRRGSNFFFLSTCPQKLLRRQAEERDIAQLAFEPRRPLVLGFFAIKRRQCIKTCKIRSRAGGCISCIPIQRAGGPRWAANDLGFQIRTAPTSPCRGAVAVLVFAHII